MACGGWHYGVTRASSIAACTQRRGLRTATSSRPKVGLYDGVWDAVVGGGSSDVCWECLDGTLPGRVLRDGCGGAVHHSVSRIPFGGGAQSQHPSRPSSEH